VTVDVTLDVTGPRDGRDRGPARAGPTSPRLPAPAGWPAGGSRTCARTSGAVPTAGVDPLDLLRLLLDPDRLAVVGAVARAPASVDELGELTGRPRDEVLRTLAPLVQATLVGGPDPDGRYHLDVVAWREVARALPQDAPASPRVAFGMTEDEAQVLGRFFRGERLVELPSQRAKRLVVLERLALEFEPGRRYLEAEVNDLLHRFHDDHATLRRQLVDEGLLDRAAGEYWRAGGRVPR
jgi:hypothetical protein